MKKILFALASAGALTAALPAQAALTDYVVEGTLTDGRTFNGALTIDSQATGYINQYSNVTMNIAGKSFNKVDAISSDRKSFFFLSFFADDYSTFQLAFNGLTDDRLRVYYVEVGSLNVANTNYWVPNVGYTNAASGTVAYVNPPPPVPEPATWMMMILGFGVAGYSMRRRNKVAVRFA